MTEAIEITTFRLTKGRTCEEFVAGNADVDVWLKKQSGFRSRRIAQRDDGVIVDMLIWASVDDATSAMHSLMDELHDSAVHTLIDQRTVTWTVSSTFHVVDSHR
ncbi:hypothetical protein PQR63_01520 [Herbaspirillum rhizosphaerae]|uniref:ABM domain-containing protein n=1 Tax=Herbaspirillum rhizosphaerae TaxID=346179 RepID=A0ABW8Z2D9_9BURK